MLFRNKTTNHEIYYRHQPQSVQGSFCTKEQSEPTFITITQIYIKMGNDDGSVCSLNYARNEFALKSELQAYQLKSNTTITHYCPIEESMNSINDFIIGAPVYLTGNVYRYDKSTKSFISSTETDTTDCICSVKTNGKWNEYVGICVKIDEKNKCITFATHGDYLVRVTDTSCYGIGDEVFVDEGELKTLTGQTAITSKIRRTTAGVITSIINKNMLAIFKS